MFSHTSFENQLVAELFGEAGSNIRLVLSQQKVQGPHPSLFEAVGLQPFGEGTAVVILKSGTGWEVLIRPYLNCSYLFLSNFVSPYQGDRLRDRHLLVPSEI